MTVLDCCFVMCELFTFKGSCYIAPIRKQILIFIFALLECILFFRNKRGEEWAVGRLIRSVKSSPEILPQIANEGKNRRIFRQSTQDGMMCSRVYPDDMLCVRHTCADSDTALRVQLSCCTRWVPFPFGPVFILMLWYRVIHNYILLQFPLIQVAGGERKKPVIWRHTL